MQWHKILTPLCAAVLLSAPVSWATAQTAGDNVLLQMQEAARKGDKARLATLLPQTAGHPLEPWAAYWELKSRLNTAAPSEVEAFLQRWRGTYQEDRMRNDWLLLLGQRRQWADFERLLPEFRMQDDREVRCYELAVQTIERRQPEHAPQEVARLWHAQRDGDDGCTQAASELYAIKKLDEGEVWKRARLSAELNRQTAARRAVDIVAPEALQHVAEVFASPIKYLAGTSKVRGNTRRELAALALIRVASNDPEQAASLMETRWGNQLRAEERDWVWGVIGKVSARRLSSDAVGYFAKVGKPERMSEEAQEWMVRANLRAGQWHTVRKTIDDMPPAMQADSTWVYWKARALLNDRRVSEAEQAEARRLLQSIASVKGFYEKLALEELGQAVTMPPAPPPPTAQEQAAVASNPGLQRALYAIRIGLRSEGVREWNYSVGLHVPGGMNDRELLAAADLACKAQIWDRCINTSERTRDVIDWNQRFPMPFHDAVIARSKSIGLDPAYVYGLIRQESRFIMDARSHVGASGLMQVMPATARWTAKKIGMTDFQPHMINDRDVNITIGTSYLKLALDDFDGSMALAAAGYNAGPGRPRNWRNGPVLDGAIWAENVPFAETRDYVKKVLSNATNYAAMITGQPQSLKARLGTIGPKLTLTEATPDLP
ncbi:MULTISPECIES: lytic transglycosylase domain-containing protein [Comamonas]|uniref:Lytic transglycosylase domain-containing protein n=1 Tax=Comamonas avium TaxID=2762231 RepID=A0ABR8S9X8_9BURK|nr:MULTISPECIES: lytic transglycosylase domain-containing protein [Comamonas]MBD7960291.1 lytic transglycosylase domain-containing protein [Comamonas avium]MBD9400605.1 lytic transglycosylase domain-containing protein [Comamonas sp. CMM02]